MALAIKPAHRLPLLIGALGLALALLLLASAVLVAATLDAAERATLAELIAPRAMLVVALWLAVFGAGAWALARAHARYLEAPARLHEQAQALVHEAAPTTSVGAQPQAAAIHDQTEPAPPRAPPSAPAERELDASGGDAAQRGLAQAFNALLRERRQLQRDIAQQVAAASRGIEQERSRLSALMAELTQSVLVCNLDGLILLYNGRARAQFRAWSRTPQTSGGAELIGLGRSIYAVFDRALIAHALDSVRERLLAGAAEPSAQFVTSAPSGQLLRVQMAPVRDDSAAPESSPAAVRELPEGFGPDVGAGPSGLTGFVLMLDDITRDFEQENLRDRLLLGLTEASRASLGNLQAALEMLELPDLEATMRERFQRVVRDEVGAMTTRVQTLSADVLAGLKTRWPMEEMLGADLVSAAARRIEALGAVRVAASEVDAALWLRVDSYSLLQALAYLAGRLVDEYQVRTLQLRLQPSGERAQLDLVWAGAGLSTETVMNWQMEPMRSGSDATPLTLRDVVERHGGEVWVERERVRHEAFFRFLLPRAEARMAAPAESAATRVEARPEFYDFDLFQATPQARALDDRALAALAYTVFDTETTGLNPSSGDEIIQIGATRIVNGKLLRHECFDQLVDPQRALDPASAAVHGIAPAMLAGQPTILEVLPVFHAFAIETVLVAHNAAFDMRFLQLKEGASGLRFDQPVLDTLLLSAWLHPNQESHRLEAIAERLGVAVAGRHTALGDAIVTAEVFLKLIPLLRARGIHTLGEARAAAQQTYQARLSY